MLGAWLTRRMCYPAALAAIIVVSLGLAIVVLLASRLADSPVCMLTNAMSVAAATALPATLPRRAASAFAAGTAAACCSRRCRCSSALAVGQIAAAAGRRTQLIRLLCCFSYGGRCCHHLALSHRRPVDAGQLARRLQLLGPLLARHRQAAICKVFVHSRLHML